MGTIGSSFVNGSHYMFNMLGFLFGGMSGDTGLTDWLLKKDNGSGEWEGPEKINCTTYLRHDDVYEKLKELPGKFGINNLNGSVCRQNNLGFQQLNTVTWGGLDEPGIGLGQSQETHAFVRQYIDKVLGENGNWSRKLIKKHVNIFFTDKKSFSTNDFKIWTTILLHKVHLNLDLSWKRAEIFIKMQKKLLIGIGIPQSLAESKVIQQISGLDKAISAKLIYINQYKKELCGMFKELNDVSDNKLTLLASNFMDSLLFAGGQSVPTVLTYCIVLLHSKWLQDRDPELIKQLNNKNYSKLPNYIMEIIRFFPPVSGFVYQERAKDIIEPNKIIYLSLHTAQCDKNVWGSDAQEFKLKDMKTYHKNMVAWADPCKSDTHPNNSRACPAKDLSFMIIYETIKAYLENGKWTPDKKPHKIKVTNYSVGSLILSKKN